jgi:diphthamide synthase (EF-2-diphthine--ammonia ligase)
MEAVFPLWKRDTSELIKEFLGLGFKTITCCVNDAYLNEAHVGVMIDAEFIRQLPENVDPCGENGEYHTFCFEGPIFRSKIGFQIGEKIYKPLELKMEGDKSVRTKGFWFCDLIPL